MQSAWDDRGQGTLTVRQQEGDSAGPSAQVVFTMESGRILINSAVYKGIKPQPVGACSLLMFIEGVASEEVTCMSLSCMLRKPEAR